MKKEVEVILMDDVRFLGKSGDIVKVKPGYARNMLLPRGFAAPVTEASRRRLAKLEEQRAAERKARKAAAEALASKLTGLTINVQAQTVDGKKLYGSVSATDILAAIEADRSLKLERRQLSLADHLREVGVYEEKIVLDEGVTVPFKVIINDAGSQEQE